MWKRLNKAWNATRQVLSVRSLLQWLGLWHFIPAVGTAVISASLGIWAHIRGLSGPNIALIMIASFFLLTLSGSILHQLLSPAKHTTEERKATRTLPTNRPQVVPVRYGTRASDNRSGLFLANDGPEAAYDVALANVRLGASELVFHNAMIPRLTREQGEILCEAWIQRTPGHVLLGSGLFDEMIKRQVNAISLGITYKDADNRSYITHCTVERDVTAAGGLVTRLIEHKLATDPVEGSPEKALESSDPQVLLEYHWRDSGEYGMTDKLSMPIVLRNAGKEAAVSVQVEEITIGNWKATFPLVPHILGGDKTSILASVEYDGMQIETVANHLIALLRPATNAGLKESRTTPAKIIYANARGERFVGAYELRWDHTKRECIAVLIALRKRN